MKFIFSFILYICFCPVLVLAGNSITAHPASQIVGQNYRFTILTPSLIRMEWSADGSFMNEATLAFINRNLETPKFRAIDSKKKLIIQTEKLTLTYLKGEKFNSNNLSVSFMLEGKMKIWKPGMLDEENLKGTMRTLDRLEGWHEDKLEEGIISRNGWALVDDSKSPVLVDDTQWTHWVKENTRKDVYDWYFFGYGHDYKQALFDFTHIAGKIPMPPKFAFGYWWSRYWQYSDDELKNLVSTIKSLDIPLDVVIIDMDWHKTFGLSYRNKVYDAAGELKGWTGYSWDNNLFPDPCNLLEWMKKNHIKTSLNLHPASGIMPYEDVYDKFALSMGWDTVGRKFIPFDMDNKKWADVYFREVIHPLEKQGIDFWWLDWQQFPYSKSIKGLSNTFWLNHVFFNNMKKKREKRPLLFHRWGGLGNHRYQIGFSGDAYITWNSLRFQPFFTSTASNVGYGYWSHDIGGHFFQKGDPKVTDPELYLRWIQYGVFSPILRTHSTKDINIERRIWKFPEQFEMMRSAIQLRYQLTLYIYNAARKAYDTGISICRPMYYEYPENELAYTSKNQYFFGDDIIVAPIVAPSDKTSGLSVQSVWLPKGNWFEMSTGSLIKGGEMKTRNFLHDEIPYYARAGSIIPMLPNNVRNLQSDCDTLCLFFTPGDNGTLNYYEDDGVTDSYANEFTTTHIAKKINRVENKLNIKIDARKGNFAGMNPTRSYLLRFPLCFPADSICINGVSITYNRFISPGNWTYDGSNLELTILTEELACDKEVNLEIHFAHEQMQQEQLLFNKVKLFKRLVPVTEQFKYIVTSYDSMRNLSESFLSISQTHSHISASPFKIISILKNFELNLEQAKNEILNFEHAEKAKLNQIVNLLSD
ncbi:MAG: glycoside hydrolase family 31 protein [Paludibacter sp.]|nr:glycoside hydrolase family 31 protein [Paludibacter sp.]